MFGFKPYCCIKAKTGFYRFSPIQKTKDSSLYYWFIVRINHKKKSQEVMKAAIKYIKLKFYSCMKQCSHYWHVKKYKLMNSVLNYCTPYFGRPLDWSNSEIINSIFRRSLLVSWITFFGDNISGIVNGKNGKSSWLSIITTFNFRFL